MGRRRDSAAVQAAKGEPGRRKNRKKLEERAADLAAAPAASAEPFAAPLFVQDESLALDVWREYAPLMIQRNLHERLYRHTFSFFCICVADYLKAVTALKIHGSEYQTVTKGDANTVIRPHPAVERKDKLLTQILELSTRFGFTPLDRVKLDRELGGLMIRDRAADLVDQANAASQAPAQQPQEESIIGAARRLQ